MYLGKVHSGIRAVCTIFGFWHENSNQIVELI